MHTTLLGSTGASSLTAVRGSDSPVSCNGANGWLDATATTRSAGSSPGPSTTPNATSPDDENRAMRTCGRLPASSSTDSWTCLPHERRGGHCRHMQQADFDFSDLYIQNDAWPRIPPPIEGLSETDSAVVRWFGRLVASRDDGTLQIDCVAWFVARLLSQGGVLVWLGQDGELLDAGLREIFAQSAEQVPE